MGLEVRLPIDGVSAKFARIPPTWRLLVVSVPQNEGRRVDVRRSTCLTEVRAMLAPLADGSDGQIGSLLADDGLVAGGSAGEESWQKTVEQALLFGKRVTCTIGS
ncbi:unnamed protein product [Polarella glacialis]|uniref:Uncharacterized protein n=1 Tax=Polarella glacialis TaxID=89957 RepID=A0A813IIZ0_POLGL|nr:unnamed protein product [Polarella glacialis]